MPPSETAGHARDAITGKVVMLAALLVATCLGSLCISASTYEVYGLDVVFRAVRVWAQTTYGSLFCGEYYTVVDLMALEPKYFQVMVRIGATFTSVLCGIILTVAGSIYQGVFRNPIAAPTMLGVSSGLNLGIVVFVLVYGTAATSSSATAAHYLFAYGGALVALGIVLGGSFLLNGPRGFNVVDMLLVGSIVSLMFSQVILYISYYVFSDELWLTYTELNEVLSVDANPLAYAFLSVAFLVTFVPVVLFRFRLNALSFDDEETRSLGIYGPRLRYFAIVIATVMVIAALAHSGMVGMASLIVPFVSRAVFGAEFRKQLLGNVLIGAVLVTACRAIADLLDIALFRMGLMFEFPVGVVASLICMPLFVWIIASQQKTWEQQ